MSSIRQRRRGFSRATLMVAAAALSVGLAPRIRAANYTWNKTDVSTYSWVDSANWTGGGFPNAIGDVANLEGALAGAQQVDLNAVITVGALNFGASQPTLGAPGFTLAGGTNGLLVLDDSDGAVSINKLNGSPSGDTISASIQFNDNLTISNNAGGGTLTLSGALRSASSDIIFSGTGPVLAGSIIVSGVISTAGNLVKNDAGSTSLGAANTYGGATTVNAGTLILTNAATLPIRSAVTVEAAGTLSIQNAMTIGSLAGGGVVTNTTGTARILSVGRNDSSTLFAGRFTATTPANLAVTKVGAGTLTLNPSQASTYTGNTVINGGEVVLDFTNTSLTSLLAATPLQITGGNFTMKGKAGLAADQTVGALTVGSTGGTITLLRGDASGAILRTGAVTATANGATLLIVESTDTSFRMGTSYATLNNRLVFNDGAANTYNWATNSGANNDTTAFTGYTALPNSGGANTTNYILTAGQTQNTSASTIRSLKLSSSGSGTQTLDLATFNMTLGGAATAAPGAILIDGTDGWNINGSTGVLRSSHLTVAGDVIFHQYSTGTVTVNAGIADNGAVAAAVANLVKAGPGTLVLAGAKTFTGAVFVNGGKLEFSNNNQLGNAAAATVVTIRDGAILSYTGATATIAGSGAASHTFSLTGGNGGIEVTQSGTNLTLSGAISGAGSLVKTGSGTLTLGVAATHSGSTFINGGTLVSSAQDLLPSTPLTIAAGATWNMSAGNDTVGALLGSGTISAGTTARGLTIGADNVSATFSGSFTGATGHTLTKTGSGIQTLDGSTRSVWTGNHIVNGGVLRLGASNVLATATPMFIANAVGSATLELGASVTQTLASLAFGGTGVQPNSQGNVLIGSGATLTVGGTLTYNVSTTAFSQLPAYISGAGTYSLGGAARTFAINDSNTIASDQPELTVSVPIAATGAFGPIKSGFGNLMLSADNTFTGTTTLTTGGLFLDYRTANGSKLSSTAALALNGGGNLVLLGNASADTSQTVASTTLASGGFSTIRLTPGGSQKILLNLGAFTRATSAGTLRFNLPTGTQDATNGIRTSTSNVDGILGGWATVTDATGATNFAANDGTGGVVLATSAAKSDVTTWASAENVTDGVLGYSGTLSQSLGVNSLRFNSAADSAVTVASGRVLGVLSGGVLQTSAGAGSSASPTITGGRLASGSGSELIFTADVASRPLVVSSAIGGSHTLTKAGNGTLRLTGVNDFAGVVYLQSGTLQAGGGNAIGDNALVNLNTNRSAVFELLGNETIGGITGGNTAQGGESYVRLNANTLSINQSSTQSPTFFLQGEAGSALVLNAGSVGTFSQTLNASNFLGSVVINGGVFQLSGASGIIGASSFAIARGSLLLDNNGTGNPTSRINDTSPITLNSADGAFTGETVVRGLALLRNTSGTVTEVVGELRISSGASYYSANVTAGATGITASDFVRTNSATLNARARNFGAGTGVRGFLRIASGTPNETAFSTNTLVGGAGGAGTQTIPIVPWAVGQTQDAAIDDSWMGNTLVTYSTDGLRPLDLATEYRTFATRTLATENVRESLTASLTGLAGTTVNALVLNNANTTAGSLDVTGSGSGQALAVTSGAMLFTATGATTGSPAMGLTLGGFGSGITVGGTNEYVIFVQNPTSAAGGGVVTATISSPLSSAADITKSGRGTLVLSSANTAGGGSRKTTVNEGVLQIDALNKIGGTSGDLVLAGGTLRFAGSFDPSSRTISFLAGGGTFDTNGNNISLSGSLGTGTGPFTKAGNGTLTLNAASALTGGTNVVAGTLALGASGAIGTGALVVSNASTLAMGANAATVSTLTLAAGSANSVTGSGILTVDGLASLGQGSVSPVLAGGMSLVKVSPAAVTVSNPANTFTGMTSVNDGILSVDAVANAGSASSLGAPTGDGAAIRLGLGLTSGSLRISSGGSAGTTDRDFWLTGTTGGGIIDNDGSAALVLNGSIFAHGGGAKNITLQGGSVGFDNVAGGVISNGFGTLGLTKAEAGTWSLRAANAYTGATTVNGGLLRLDYANAAATADIVSASSALVLGGGTLGVVGKSSTVNSQTFASTTLTGGTFGGVSVDGTGSTSMSVDLKTLTRGANSGVDFEVLGGATVSVAGLVSTNGIITSAASGPAYVTFNRTDWANFSSGSPVAVSSYSSSYGAGLNTDVSSSASPSVFTTNTLRFNASGATTLTLTGANTLAAGGLLIGKDAGAVTIAGSAASLGGFAHTTSAGELNVFQHSSSLATISAAVTNTSTAPSFLRASITGSALNKFGNGVLVLSSAGNAYTGGTNVGSGTLRLGASHVIPNGIGIATSGNVTVGPAGTLDLAGFSETINGLAGSGLVDSSLTGTMRLTLGDNNAAQAFSGVIRNSSGTLSLVKTGTGAQTLSGASSYSGTTTVSQGSLTLNFTAAGAPLTGILPATALTIGSGTLSLTGSTVANAQSFSGTSLAGGAAVAVTGTTPAVTLDLGAITRVSGAGSSLNFTITNPSTVRTSTSNNAAGILGGWATVGGADWAIIGASGNVAALSAYTGTLPTAATVAATANYTLSGAQTQAGDVTLNSLKITGGTAYTLATGSFGLTLGSGGAGGIVASNTATVTIGSSASGTGVVGPATGSGNEFLIFNSGTLLFNAPIRGAGLIKSGAGTLQLRATTAASLSGTVAVNGGTLDVDAANRINGATVLLLNGGTFFANGAFSIGQALSLGAAGGAITQENDADRNLGSNAAMTFVGTGPRTLTINNNRSSRLYTLQAAIGDADANSPTSINLNGNSNEALLRLNPGAASNYTGNTIITRGILRLNRSDAVNGAGGLLSTATSGNIVFGATGTNRAILETNSTAGTITRGVGYGPGQISWQGNGGFSNSTGLTQVVNLGGSAVELVWGAGGFVPTDSQLQFGQAAANNLPSQGAIDFRNGINLGSATRTINVIMPQLFNASNGGITGILSGNITSGSNAGITKTGAGTLLFTGANSSTTASLTISEGSLVFEDDNAVFALNGRNITLLSAEGRSAIGKLGDANPLATWGGRIVNASTAFGTFLLGADSSETLDFRDYANMRLAGFDVDSFAEGAAPSVVRSPVFTGTIIPSSGIYRLGGTGVSNAVGASLATLVLGRANVLTGTNQLNFTSGQVAITQTNDFSGGTVLSNNGIEGSILGIGSNAALGTGVVTFSGSGNTFRWGAVNGDQFVANNITWGSNTTSNWVPNGDIANEAILANQNQGTIAYLGSVDMAGRVNPIITSRVRGTLFHGDWKGGGGSGLTWSISVGGYVSMLATAGNAGVPKAYSGPTTVNVNATVVIDDSSSFGSAGTVFMGSGTTAASQTILVQPGTSSVDLGTRAFTFNSGNSGTPVALDTNFSAPSGSTLTIGGVITGTNFGNSKLVKTGLGTLVLSGQSPAATTTAAALTVNAGTLRLDAAAAGGAVWVSGVPIVLGTASGTFGGGGTLEITGASAQTFGNVTVNPRSNVVSLTGAMALTLGTVTRTAGSTLNLSVASGASVSSSSATVAGLVNGATTWNSNDWAAASGTAITRYSAYTEITGATPVIASSGSANYLLSSSTTGDVTLAATGTIDANTLKHSDANNRTIDIRNGVNQGTLRLGANTGTGSVTTVGGVLVASGAGALTFGVVGTPGTLTAGGTTSNAAGDLVFINNSTNDITVNAVIANNGTTAIPVAYDGRGTGKLILAGVNTFTGAIILNKGVLEVGTVNSVATAGPLGQGTAAVTNILLNGGTFRANLSADGSTDKGFTVNAPSVIDVVANKLTLNTTLSGMATERAHINLLNAGILTKSGAGTLELKDLTTNANNAHLSIRVSQGVLLLNKTTTTSGTLISAVNLAGGAGVIVDSVASGDAPVLRLSGTGGNQISDDSSVLLMGDKAVKGVFDLNGKNETIDGLAGGGIVRSGIAGEVTLSVGGNNSAGISAYTLAAAAAGVNATGLNSFSGTIEDGLGTVSLTKVGSGTQILRSAQTYSGATIVSAGTLRLAFENALPYGSGKGGVELEGDNVGINYGANSSTGSDKVLAPGILDMSGFNQTINALDSTTGGIVTNNPFLDWDGDSWDVDAALRGTKTLTVGASGSNGAFNGIIQDGFAVAPGAITGVGHVGVINLVKTGGGTQTLSGANTYSGTTAVQDGALVLTGGANRLPATTAVTLGSGAASGVLQLGGVTAVTQTVAGLTTAGSGAGNKVVGGNAANSTLTVNQSGTASYSGALGGVGTNENNLSFTLQGGGTLTLSGSNTLTGSTTVRGGSTLVLASGLPASPLNVGGASAGTVVSVQTLGGLVTVGSGGNLAVGAAAASDIGTLTLSNGLTMSAGSLLSLQVGSAQDLLRVTAGTLTFNGGAFSLSESSGLTVGTYDLIDYAGATLGGSGIANLGLASSVLGASNLYVTLQNDSVAHRVRLVVDNARFWSGSVGRTWEASQGVANWAPAQFFQAGDKVLFRDTYPSDAGNVAVVNTTIELPAGVSAAPAAMTFSNSLVDYVLHGAGEIAGTTGLTKSGTGGLTILNANAFTGATTITEGYVEMRDAAALGTTAGGITVNAGGTLRLSGGIAVGAKALTLAGTGAGDGGALRNVSGGNAYAGAVTLGGAARINSDAGTLTLSGALDNNANLLTLGGAGDVVVSGTVSGAGGLTVDGTGVVTLSDDANSFSGKTTVKSGVLSVSKVGSVGGAGGLGTVTGTANGTIALGDLTTTGTLRWTGSSNETTDRVIGLAGTTGGGVVDASGTGSLTLSEAISASGVGLKTLTLTGTGGTTVAPNSIGTISDGASGGLSLVKTGTGVWSLASTNSYSGTTSVLQGTLQLGANQDLGGLTLGGLSRASSTLGLGSATAKLTGGVTYSAADGSAGAMISGAGTLDLGGDPEAVAAISRVFTVGSSRAAGGADLTVSAVIADAGGATSTFANGLTKTGAGTLVLTGANTYAGATAVDGGRLSVAPQAIVNSLTINVGTGATAGSLDLYADGAAAALTFTGDNVLNIGGTTVKGGLGFNLGGAEADSIVLSATGALNVGAAGGLINARALSAVTSGAYVLIDATAASAATIAGFELGVLTGGYAYSLDNSTGGQLKLNVGAAAAGPYYWTGARSTGSWATLGGNGTTSNWATVSSGGSDAGATPGVIDVIFDGASATATTLDQPYSLSGLTLSGAGNVTIDAGSGDGMLTLGSGGVSVSTGAASTGHVIGANVVLGSAQTWTVADAGQLLTVGGDVSGGFGLTKAGAGLLVLSGVNAFSGAVTVNGGVLSVASSAGLGDGGATNTLSLAGGTLRSTGAAVTLGANRTVALGAGGGAFDVTAGNSLTVDGAVSGSTGLTKAGDGTLVLAGANSGFSGAVAVNGGVLSIGASGNLGDASETNTLSLAGGTLRSAGASVTLGTNRSVALGTGGGTLDVTSGGTLTVDGLLSGSAGLTKAGAGTLVLGGANTGFGGGVTVSAGTVRIGAANRLGDGGAANVVTLGDAALNVTATFTDGRGYVIGHAGSAIDVDTGATLTLANGAATNLSGTGVLNLRGAGTVVLDDALNANAFTGGSVLSGGGTVRISTATSLGAQTGAAALKDVTLQAVESITTTRAFTLASSASRITVDSAKTFAVSGVIADGAQAGALTKLGDGVLELSGENTFSGGVNVTAGILRVSNAAGSAAGTGAVTVTGASSVLTGTGAVSGAVTVGSGSTLSPGGASSAGLLTLGGLTLSANSKLNFRLGANTAASDRIAVTGSGAFTAAGGALTLDTTTLTGFGTGTYNLITYAGALGGSFTNLSLASPNLANASGDKFYGYLVNNAGSVDLQTTNSLTWNGDVSGTKWVNSTSTDANFKVGTNVGVNFQDTMSALFDDTAASFTVNLPGAVTPSSVTFSAATDYTLQGAGKITGAATLSKSGSGRLTVDAANDFSGTVTLSAGSVEMKDPAALGTGSIEITAGASLRLNDDGSGPIVLGSRISSYGGAAAILNVAGQNSANLGTPSGITSFVSEAGKLTLSVGTLVVNTDRHLTLLGTGGDIEITGTSIGTGNFNFTSNMGVGSSAVISPSITVGTDRTVTVNGPGSTTFKGNLTSSSTGTGLSVSSTGTNMFEGTVTVNGAGGGIALAGGTNTFANNVTINASGTLALSGGTTTFGDATKTVNTNGGAVSLTGASNATFNASVTSGGGLWTVSSSGSSTLNGAITGTGALTKTGSGTLTFNAPNPNFNGAISLAATSGTDRGIIVAAANNALGLGAVTATFVAGANRAQVRLSGGASLGNAFTISGAGSDGTVDGIIRSVTGSNALAGNISIANSGSIAGATLRADLDSTLTLGGAITPAATGRFLNLTGDGSFVFGAGGSLANSGANTLGLWVGNAGTTTINSTTANTYTLATAIGAGSTLEVANLSAGGVAGSLGAATTAAANLLLDGGTLRYAGSGAQSTDRLFSIGSSANGGGGATLDASGATSADTMSFLGAGAIGFTGMTATVTSGEETGPRTLTLTGTNTGANTLTSIIGDQAAGTGVTSLVKSGAGTWVVNGNNTFTGGTTLSAGTIRVGHASAFGSLATQALALNGGTLTSDADTARIFANNVTIGGDVALGAAATFTGALTFNGTVGLGAAVRTLTVNSDVTFGGIVAGDSAGGLTKNGAGTLTLSGANTFTGATTVAAGVLAVSHASGLGTAGGSTSVTSGAELRLLGDITIGSEAITLNGAGISSGGALRNLSGSNALGGAVTLASAARINSDDGMLTLTGGVSSTDIGLTVGGAGNVTVSTNGLSLGTGTLTKDGAGTFTIAAASTFSGAITISGGKLQIGAGSTTGSVGAGAISNAGTLEISRSDDLTFANVISGAGAFIKSGTGNLTLSGANDFTGAATVSAGVLVVGDASALGTSGGPTSVTSGAELRLQGGITIASEAITLNGSGVSSAGALRNASGNNALGGAITLASASRINSDDGTLALSGGISGSNLGLTIGGSGNVTINTTGLSLGAGALTKEGAGLLLLSVSNTFTGGTTISAGTLKIGDSGALGGGNVTVATGATLDLNDIPVSNAITLASGAFLLGGQSVAEIPTTGTVTSVLSGEGGLNKTDAGELVLTTPNFFQGATSVSGATAVIKAAFLADDSSSLGVSSLSNPANLVLSNGATLEFTGAQDAVTSRSFTVVGSAAIAATGTGALVFNSDSVIAISGENPSLTLRAENVGAVNRFEATVPLESPGLKNVTIDGTGQWVIAGPANRFAGDFRLDVTGGLLKFESGALGAGNDYSSSVISIANGSTLAWAAGNSDDISSRLEIEAGTVAKLQLEGNVTFASAPGVFDGASATIEKKGSGTLTLDSGVSASTLDVTLTSGKLVVNGTVGDVTVASGTVLGGSGTVGTVGVGSGGTFAPGNSPGLLTSTSLALAGGSTYSFDVTDATAAAGTGYDSFITGTLDLTGASVSSKITLKVISMNASSTPGTVPVDFSSELIYSLTFGTYTNILLPAEVTNINDIFAIDVSQFQYTEGSPSSAGLWSLSYSDGTVTLTAVPEPSTYGFALGALALAAAAVRRRRKQAAQAKA